MYVNENPINFIDPLGRWDILPGFTLSDGGFYGQGLLTVPGPLCEETCLYSPSTTSTLSVFVPKVFNGKIYNDLVHITPDGHVYTAIESTFRCLDGAFPFYIWSNDWVTTHVAKGKSYSFSTGFFDDFTSGIALGNGYSGPVPEDLTFSDSYNQNWAITLQLWRSQPIDEREMVNFVKIFDNAANSKTSNIINGVIGTAVFAAQALSGVRALNSRNISIIIQKNKNAPSLRRAIIESLSSWKTDDLTHYFFWNYIDFENGEWQQHHFHTEKRIMVPKKIIP
jgi:hypothetical protein